MIANSAAITRRIERSAAENSRDQLAGTASLRLLGAAGCAG